jgi:hypothetical protein
VTPAPLAAADCERIRAGPVGQPVNAASSLAYLGAGADLIARGRRAPAGRRAWLVAYGAATAANGIGGVAYHGPGGVVSRWLHDSALLATLGLMALADAERLAGDEGWYRGSLAVVAGAGALAAVPRVSSAAQAAAGGMLVAGEAATFVRGRRGVRADGAARAVGPGPPGRVGRPTRAASAGRLRRRYVPMLVGGGVAAATYRASRSGGPLCRPDSLVQGHGIWHVLTALMLWWWGREALDGGDGA